MGSHLSGQPQESVPQEHVFSLTPGAVDQNDVVRCSGEIRAQILQIVGRGSGIQQQGARVSTHGRQLRISDTETRSNTCACRTDPITAAVLHLSSENRRPMKTLHLPGGRHATRSGTVRRTRLSYRKKKEDGQASDGVTKRMFEMLGHRPRPGAGRCRDTWRRQGDAAGDTGTDTPSPAD